MQGSYKNDGLPRPYYMKPVTSKKHSPYDKMPTAFFNSNRRKLFGYLIVLSIFGACIYLMSVEMRPGPDPIYEVMHSNEVNRANNAQINLDTDLAQAVGQKQPKAKGNVDTMVDSVKNADKEAQMAGLAVNMAKGSKGDIGHGIMEAPKGGIANEAPIVGNDADAVVGQGSGNVDANGKTKPKTYRANKGSGDEIENADPNSNAPYQKDTSKDKSVKDILNETDGDDFKVKADP